MAQVDPAIENNALLYDVQEWQQVRCEPPTTNPEPALHEPSSSLTQTADSDRQTARHSWRSRPSRFPASCSRSWTRTPTTIARLY